MGWLRQVLDWQRDLTDPEEFMEYLKTNISTARRYSSSHPKGT